MKTNYFTQTDPINYCAEDNMKHLYFKDYKYLKDVKLVDDYKVVWADVFGAIMLIVAFLSISVVLFLSEV